MTGWVLTVIFLHIGDNGEAVYRHEDSAPKIFLAEEACHIAGNNVVTREIEVFDFDKYPGYIVRYECNEIHAVEKGGRLVWPMPERVKL